MKTFSRLFLSLAFIVTMFAFVCAQTNVVTNVSSLTLTDLNDKSFTFASQKGNILLISFGATWCPSCKTELKALGELQTEYKDKNVKFFWVSIDDKATQNKKISDFAKSLKFTLPILRDPESKTYFKFTARQLLPAIVFTKSDGTVVSPVHFGMFPTAEDFKKHLRRRIDAIQKAEKPA